MPEPIGWPCGWFCPPRTLPRTLSRIPIACSSLWTLEPSVTRKSRGAIGFQRGCLVRQLLQSGNAVAHQLIADLALRFVAKHGRGSPHRSIRRGGAHVSGRLLFGHRNLLLRLLLAALDEFGHALMRFFGDELGLPARLRDN